MTNDPSIMQYMTSPRSNFTRGPWYEAFNTTPDRTNVLSERDEKHHKQLRAKLMRGVSYAAMRGMNLTLLTDMSAVLRKGSAQPRAGH